MLTIFFCSTCSNFGLKISTENIEVWHQPAPGTPAPYITPNATVNCQSLVSVDKFPSIISKNANVDNEGLMLYEGIMKERADVQGGIMKGGLI